jgi:nucleotidyltransferase/DNA polymerase involved in DNA repair
MADESQLIDDALETLKEIRDGYRDEPVSKQAALMAQQIRPTMTFDQDIEERRRIYDRTPKEFADAAAAAVAKRAPTYKTPVFKCLEDFEKCKKSSTSQTLCRAALAICVGKHLIPFVRHK